MVQHTVYRMVQHTVQRNAAQGSTGQNRAAQGITVRLSVSVTLASAFCCTAACPAPLLATSWSFFEARRCPIRPPNIFRLRCRVSASSLVRGSLGVALLPGESDPLSRARAARRSAPLPSPTLGSAPLPSASSILAPSSVAAAPDSAPSASAVRRFDARSGGGPSSRPLWSSRERLLAPSFRSLGADLIVVSISRCSRDRSPSRCLTCALALSARSSSS